MALIAWYPLNGDTKDYSGSNNNAQSNSSMPTVNDEGKIGKCYSFNSNCMLINNEFNINTEEFTIAFWCNLNATTNHCFYSARTAIGGGVSIFALNNNFRFDFAGDLWKTGIVAPNNKWTHVAFVKKNDTRMCYINGVLTAKNPNLQKISDTFFNIASIGASTENGNIASANNYLKGKLNDYRIYNEALSAKQIKEIAQAKICHYTFNEELYENTTNLYSNYPTLGGTGEYENSEFKAEKTKIEDGYYRYKWYKKVTKNFWPNIQFPAYEFTPGKNYTISVDIKMIERRNKATVEIRHSAINNDYGTPGRKNVSITNSPLGEWKRYTLTRSFDETTSLNGTTYNVSPRMEIYATMANEGDYLEFEVRNYQVEEKDHTTPFTSNKRIHTLKDISGYNHDMTSSLEVSPVWKNDEQKSYVRLTEKAYYCFNDLNIVNLKEFTYSCWIRTSDDQSYNLLGSPTENNSNHSMAIMSGKICFHTYFHTPDTKADKNYAVSKTIITDNQWHLATITYDNSVVKTYIDGKLENQSNLTMNFDTYEGNKIGLNLWNINDMGDYEIRRFSGDIKDVRIYATALSAEDIKLLYQPEISIDKANVIRCSEINEERIENKKGFSKDASITYNEFNEIPNIDSGVHNLKLGDQILPVLVDMDNDGGRWARVFYHNCKSGTVLFSSENSFAEAKETNINAPTTSDKYSILSKLESFRPNTKSPFEFRIKYPTDTDSGLNKWTMKHYSNVTLASAETYPLLSDIEGLTPTSETIVEDTNNFIPSLVGDYYIRHYKTKVYSSIAKNINFQIKSDDGVTCYVNNNIAFQKKTSTFNDVKISLNKGWNTLEFLYYENAGQDYLILNQKISELVDILDYNGTYNDSNIWKQTSNPTYEKIAGYTPVKINWTSNFWGGLEWTNGSITLIDGSVNHGNWYYAIGVSTKHRDGMPSSADIMKNSSTPNDVELWVRINNYDLFADNLIENVSISRNGVLTAKEFREI